MNLFQAPRRRGFRTRSSIRRDATSTNVNGQERGANNTRVDGSANILVTMPHHTVYVPPVESIEEVNISTNNFDAEQGMTGGAAVTVVTKSGTNDLHGSVSRCTTTASLRAFIWDENRAGVTEKPKGNRNIDGGSIGGPIKKNKLFFFRTGKAHSSAWDVPRLFSVPTADFRTGDFSRMLGAHILDATAIHPSADDRGWHDTTSRGHDFRSVHWQSGWHGPIGVFERWEDQRHPSARLNPDDEDAGAGSSAQSVWR